MPRGAGGRGGIVAASRSSAPSLFDLDLRRDLPWRGEGPLLVVGNPPWVTSAELGALGSDNHPRKSNIKGLRGLDARTGAVELRHRRGRLAQADRRAGRPDADDRPALQDRGGAERPGVRRADGPAGGRGLARTDRRPPLVRRGRRRLPAPRDARPEARCPERVPVFADLQADVPEAVMGFARGRLVADLDAYQPRAFADGRCPMSWRQGVKHDAAAVMELAREGDTGTLRNRLGEPVDVEPDHVYPLLKGADLAVPAARRPARAVVVTQRRLGEDTRPLEATAPRLWAYLQAHAAAFARRRSSIYEAGRRSRCSASGRTASPRTRSPSRACTRPRRSARSARTGAGR